jgi:hypothetical protein
MRFTTPNAVFSQQALSFVCSIYLTQSTKPLAANKN